jgi:hypothetical protein
MDSAPVRTCFCHFATDFCITDSVFDLVVGFAAKTGDCMRTNRATKLAFPLLLVGFLCSACAPKPVQDQRRALDQATTIQGYPCAKGYAWYYADDRLNRCTVTRDMAFGEAWIPAGSIIQLQPDGSPQLALMRHNAPVRGVRCAGGGLLGPAEGSITEFYPSGKLKLCFLAGDQTVQGVPCVAGGFWAAMMGHEAPVEFREDGKLKSCWLAADFDGKHRGDKFAEPE